MRLPRKPVIVQASRTYYNAHVFEGEFEFAGQEHFYLETNAALASIDENGQIFREAWGLASDELRQTVVQTVTRSGNARLIDAYTKALGVGSGGGCGC